MYLKYFKIIVSTKIQTNQPYWGILFTLHNDASNKNLSVVASNNDENIKIFSIRLINAELKHTTKDK